MKLASEQHSRSRANAQKNFREATQYFKHLRAQCSRKTTLKFRLCPGRCLLRRLLEITINKFQNFGFFIAEN